MKTTVGLDIGNSKCVVAVSTDGVADAVLNQDSKRETPTVVHFAEKHRLFGTAAASYVRTKHESTISQLKRLLDGANLPEEDHCLQHRTSKSTDGGISVKVKYLNKERKFTAVEMLVMLVSHLKRSVALTKGTVECVIGVPAYFTDQQKNAYRNAATIAGWSPLGLLHEGVATALEYRNARAPGATDTVVMFVDIGHCDTQVTVVEFKGETMRVLAEVCDSNLGGRDFDEVIFQYFVKMLDSKGIKNIRSNVKASLRLRAASEKAKRVLSANREANESIEYLMEGAEYVDMMITRETFEELSGDLVDRIGGVFREALKTAKVDVNGIDSVEMVGNGSRIPAISRILTGLFRRSLSRTLNGSECVARGCALLCEMLRTLSTPSNYEELMRTSGITEAVFTFNNGDVDLSSLIERENWRRQQDLTHEREKIVRNALESFIIEERNKRLRRSIAEANDEEILKRLNDTVDWLDGEGEDKSDRVYIIKWTELKSFISSAQIQETTVSKKSELSELFKKEDEEEMQSKQNPDENPSALENLQKASRL